MKTNENKIKNAKKSIDKVLDIFWQEISLKFRNYSIDINNKDNKLNVIGAIDADLNMG